MEPMKDLIVRTMTAREVSTAIAWAAQEGWNPGLQDAECFYAADPGGFFLAELHGRPVGCLSAVAYDQRFGFAGLYLVRPDMRGRGIGRELARQAAAYVGGRTVGNDAVVAQQEAYTKFGFAIAHRNIRFRGTAPSIGTAAPEITDLYRVSFDEITAYDRRHFPADRPTFLRCWVSQREGTALGFMEKGRLAGYGVIRKCLKGHKIGPLFADSASIAESLFLALAGRASGDEVFLDCPEPNAWAVALAERYRMEPVFETARMYVGEAPALPLDNIFGITSFELG